MSALAITAANLNGATIADGSGDAANLSGALITFPNIAIDPPSITGLTDSPASGDLGVGKTVTLTLSLSEAVTVSGGTPTLTLNDGGVATYVERFGHQRADLHLHGRRRRTPTSPRSPPRASTSTGRRSPNGPAQAANLSLTGFRRAARRSTSRRRP